MRPGQDLAAAGYAGLSGTARIAAQKEAELLTHFSRQFVKNCRFVDQYGCRFSPEAGAGCSGAEAVFLSAGAVSWMEAGEGGILAALWNYFEDWGLGFEIELRALPIRQETVEVCEFYNLNPYRLHSEGCVLLAADNGGDLVRKLKKEGIHAAVIGKVTAGPARRIENDGSQGYLYRPKADELMKIFGAL